MTDWVRKPSAIFAPVDETPAKAEHAPEPASAPVSVPKRSANQSAKSSIVSGGCLVVRATSGWLIHCGSSKQMLPSETDVPEIVGVAKEALDRDGGASMKCVIAVESVDCFFVEANVPNGIDVRDRTAVSFELEHHFPLDAEAMAADFCVAPAMEDEGQRIAALAVDAERLKPLTEAFQEQGIEVVLIVPTSFLIARAVVERSALDSSLRSASSSHPSVDTAVDLWLLEDDHCEAMRVDGDGVWRWKQFSDGEDGLESDHNVVVARGGNGGQVFSTVVIGQDASTFQKSPLASSRNVDAFETDTAGLLSAGASIALGDRWGRWLDLRRGDLAPADPLYAVAQPLRWLALAAVFCFLICSIAAWFRGERIQSEIENVLSRQRAAFQEAFPGRRVPIALVQSVRREHKKVIGSRGGDDAVEVPVPATEIISQLYRGFENARQDQRVRFRLIDLNVTSGEVSITVRVRETAQVVALTKALEDVGFTVSPPATDQIDPSKDERVVTYQSTMVAAYRTKNLATDFNANLDSKRSPGEQP